MGGSKALILSAHVTQWLLFILGKIVWDFFLQNFNGVFCLNFSFLFYRFSKSFLEFLKKIETHHILTQVWVLVQFFTGFLHSGQMVFFFTNKFLLQKFQPEKYDIELYKDFCMKKMAQIPQILKENNLKSPDLVIGSGWGDRRLWVAAIWPPKLGNVSNTWGNITYHKICNEHYNLPPGNNENLVYVYIYTRMKIHPQ